MIQLPNYYEAMAAKVNKGKEVFISPGAYVLGDVTLADKVSVWFTAVIRADYDRIDIGEGTNVQEGVIMHVDYGTPMTIGKENIIGHGAILHGCTIGDFNLIGMRATILNRAKIGNGCVIGANALVTEGMVIPDYSMVVGVPAKIVKTLSEETITLIRHGSDEYIKEAAKYLQSSVG